MRNYAYSIHERKKIRNPDPGTSGYDIFLASPAFAAAPLDPTTIPKFVTQIEPLPHWLPTEVDGVDTYQIDVAEFTESILPPTFSAPNCTGPCLTTAIRVWWAGNESF